MELRPGHPVYRYHLGRALEAGGLEQQAAAASGAPHAVATASGTAGLHAALTAVGAGRDDLVVLPSLTFVASANAIAHCGAEPWLMDVSAESWTLAPA